MGAAAGVTLALALLMFSCVFAAMAGPAVSLHLRTGALHQALNRVGPLGTSIEIDASWNTFTAAFTGQQVLTEDDLSGATSTLASGVAASVPLAGGSWRCGWRLGVGERGSSSSLSPRTCSSLRSR